MGEQVNRFRDLKQAIDDVTKAQKRAQAFEDAGRQLTESLRTPIEKFRDEVVRVNELLLEGVISQETAVRAVARAQKVVLGDSKLMIEGRHGFKELGKSFQNALIKDSKKDFERQQLGLLKAGLQKQDVLIQAVLKSGEKPAILI